MAQVGRQAKERVVARRAALHRMEVLAGQHARAAGSLGQDAIDEGGDDYAVAQARPHHRAADAGYGRVIEAPALADHRGMVAEGDDEGA
jgi:hypothetical protein